MRDEMKTEQLFDIDHCTSIGHACIKFSYEQKNK
jgi:hypothetical protein